MAAGVQKEIIEQPDSMASRSTQGAETLAEEDR